MSKSPRKILLVNAFGTLGYFACLMLWGWTGIVYFPVLLENEQIEEFILPPARDESAPVSFVGDVPPTMALVALAVTVIIMVMTIIVVLRAPVTIARTGKAVTTKAAGSALPIITKGRPLPLSEKKRLTVQLIKLMKLLLVVVPVALSMAGLFVTPPIALDIIVLVSSALALIAIFWFALQYIMARALHLEPKQLV